MTNKTGKFSLGRKDHCTFSLILNILHKKTENIQPEVERRQLAPLGEREYSNFICQLKYVLPYFGEEEYWKQTVFVGVVGK